MGHISREHKFQHYIASVPEIRLCIDDGSLGLISNCAAAWRNRDASADYHCVLQDDLLLTTDFAHKVDRYLDLKSSVYHFYLPNRQKLKPAVHEAMRDGKNHVHFKNVYAGQAICFKNELIDDMLVHYEKCSDAVDDQRINSFIRSKCLQVCFPIPSLVQHLPFDFDSLHAHNKSKLSHRVAMHFEE
jgi:hypothetical protein